MTAFMGAARRAGLMHAPQAPSEIVDRALPGNPPRPVHWLVTTGAHLGFGAGAGVLFGAMWGTRAHLIPAAVTFSLGVWASSYAGWLPALGLMPTPAEDDRGRPPVMIAAHAVYGLSLAGALAVMRRVWR